MTEELSPLEDIAIARRKQGRKRKRTDPLEKVIEKKVCDYARSIGWLVYKWSSPNSRGVPDRIFIRSGTVMFIEFKRKGAKPTKLQARVHEQFRQQGFHVHVIDSIDAGLRLMGGKSGSL